MIGRLWLAAAQLTLLGDGAGHPQKCQCFACLVNRQPPIDEALLPSALAGSEGGSARGGPFHSASV